MGGEGPLNLDRGASQRTVGEKQLDPGNGILGLTSSRTYDIALSQVDITRRVPSGVRCSMIDKKVKSLILAQNERWRRG